MTVIVEKILQERNVDAALYLLSRMLGITIDASKRRELEVLQRHIRDKGKVDSYDSHNVVMLYREVIG